MTNVCASTGGHVEHDPHADALRAVACGQYEKAIAEYRRILKKNRNDTYALSEIAHVYCDRLHQPEAAKAILEKALDRDWPFEDAAFLSFRLADVYWNHQQNPDRAKALLEQVV